MDEIISHTGLIDATIQILHEFLFVDSTDIADIDRVKVEKLWLPTSKLYQPIADIINRHSFQDSDIILIQIGLSGINTVGTTAYSSLSFRVQYVGNNTSSPPKYIIRTAEDYYLQVYTQITNIQEKRNILYEHFEAFMNTFHIFDNTYHVSVQWIEQYKYERTIQYTELDGGNSNSIQSLWNKWCTTGKTNVLSNLNINMFINSDVAIQQNFATILETYNTIEYIRTDLIYINDSNKNNHASSTRNIGLLGTYLDKIQKHPLIISTPPQYVFMMEMFRPLSSTLQMIHLLKPQIIRLETKYLNVVDQEILRKMIAIDAIMITIKNTFEVQMHFTYNAFSHVTNIDIYNGNTASDEEISRFLTSIQLSIMECENFYSTGLLEPVLLPCVPIHYEQDIWESLASIPTTDKWQSILVSIESNIPRCNDILRRAGIYQRLCTWCISNDIITKIRMVSVAIQPDEMYTIETLLEHMFKDLQKIVDIRGFH
jgi:hypothetical protein